MPFIKIFWKKKQKEFYLGEGIKKIVEESRKFARNNLFKENLMMDE